MAKRSGGQIRLGRLELQMMDVVWRRGKATVHQVRDTLGGRKRAYSTVLTMMRKLEAKGYLEHEMDGRTYVYSPTISREEVRQGIIGDVLDRVFEGSPALLLASLVEKDRISEEELRQIRKLVGKKGEKK